jgi:hypothetical protein
MVGDEIRRTAATVFGVIADGIVRIAAVKLSFALLHNILAVVISLLTIWHLVVKIRKEQRKDSK